MGRTDLKRLSQDVVVLPKRTCTAKSLNQKPLDLDSDDICIISEAGPSHGFYHSLRRRSRLKLKERKFARSSLQLRIRYRGLKEHNKYLTQKLSSTFTRLADVNTRLADRSAELQHISKQKAIALKEYENQKAIVKSLRVMMDDEISQRDIEVQTIKADNIHLRKQLALATRQLNGKKQTTDETTPNISHESPPESPTSHISGSKPSTSEAVAAAKRSEMGTISALNGRIRRLTERLENALSENTTQGNTIKRLREQLKKFNVETGKAAPAQKQGVGEPRTASENELERYLKRIVDLEKQNMQLRDEMNHMKKRSTYELMDDLIKQLSTNVATLKKFNQLVKRSQARRLQWLQQIFEIFTDKDKEVAEIALEHLEKCAGARQRNSQAKMTPEQDLKLLLDNNLTWHRRTKLKAQMLSYGCDVFASSKAVLKLRNEFFHPNAQTQQQVENAAAGDNRANDGPIMDTSQESMEGVSVRPVTEKSRSDDFHGQAKVPVQALTGDVSEVYCDHIYMRKTYMDPPKPKIPKVATKQRPVLAVGCPFTGTE